MKKVISLQKVIILIITCLILVILIFKDNSNTKLPIIAIANYGPHSSLDDCIYGIKEELTKQGFVENETVKYDIVDVGFDSSLIPQMIANLKNKKPKVMLVLTTPVAQFAKQSITDIPLIFASITDPIGAKLIKEKNKSDGNMTGSADQQNLSLFIDFAKSLIPNLKRIGMLYSTSESNDESLVKMMADAAKQKAIKILAIPVEEARDIPVRMQKFKDNVELIYVGTSGPIQPALPAIIAEANKMGIAIINSNDEGVKNNLILASFGVDNKKVGMNAGQLAVQILNGADIKDLKPIYPDANDHYGLISKANADKRGIKIPDNLVNTTIIE